MRIRSISGVAATGALALAVLLAPAPASAGDTIASGWMKDPTGDVERDGFSKKDVSDLTKLKVAITSKSVTVTLTFEKLKQKKLDVELPFVNEYGTGALLRYDGARSVEFSFNDSPEPLSVPLQNGLDALREGAAQPVESDVVCEAQFSDETGKKGTITASFQRSCVTPDGKPKAESIQLFGAVGLVPDADGHGFADLTPGIALVSTSAI